VQLRIGGELIDDRLRAELDSRQQRCLGGEQALKNFKGRMTRRDGNLVGLGLDRVLWSPYWATPRMVDRPFDGDALTLIDGDLNGWRLGGSNPVPTSRQHLEPRGLAIVVTG
jgi:hypothetical protein